MLLEVEVELLDELDELVELELEVLELVLVEVEVVEVANWVKRRFHVADVPEVDCWI